MKQRTISTNKITSARTASGRPRFSHVAFYRHGFSRVTFPGIVIIALVALIAVGLSNCKSTDSIFCTVGEKEAYIFYTKDNIDYKSSEPLAAFIDHEGMFHIFELEHKIHYTTLSRTKFIEQLSKICSKNYYERIAYLTLNKKPNRYAVIEDIILDSTLVQITGYKTQDAHSFKNVRPLEEPNPELRFCFGDDFIY